MEAVLMPLMKTPHTPRKIMKLLAVALLPLSICSVVSAQTTPAAGNPPASNQACNPAHAHHEHKGWKNLSAVELQQLKADLKKIHQDPQLVTARQAVKDAQTHEAKTAAKTSLCQIRHDLLVKADPSIEPILAKIVQGHHDKDE